MGKWAKPSATAQASARPNIAAATRGYGGEAGEALHNAIAAKPLFGHERGKTAHPANGQCRWSGCETRAAVTFTSTYISKSGEQVERREQICWEHYQQRRNGIVPASTAKPKAKVEPRVRELTPADLAKVAAYLDTWKGELT